MTDQLPLIGIYGGTFDPIHYGHLRIMEELSNSIDWDRVYFVPSGSPRLRNAPVASRDHRSAMVSLAIQGNRKFMLDDREIKRAGISTTVESLQEYRSEYGHATALCFIMGMDVFENIHQWHNWRELFNLCHLIIVNRPGSASLMTLHHDIKEELNARHVLTVDHFRYRSHGSIYMAQTPLLEISATQIRTLLTAGRSIRYLLPDAVLDYIQSNHLYSGRT